MQVNVRYLRFNEMDIPIINIDGNDFLTSGDFGRICGVVRTNLTNIMRMGKTFTYKVGESKEIDYVIQRSNPKSRFSRLIDLGVRYPILNSIRLKTPFSLFISRYEEMSGLNSNVIQIVEYGESRFGYMIFDYFSELGYSIERQKTVYIGDKRYRLDFYLTFLSVCIEFDEVYHTESYNNARDLDLLKIGIRTIRVSERWSIGKSIAFISRQLFDMKLIK